MPEYLSKEEIRQWRSSLEKITLEEYAQRLGKVICEEKETNDMVDKVMKSGDFITYTDTTYKVKAEKITSLAERAYERELEIKSNQASIKETPKVNHEKETVKSKPAKKVEVKQVAEKMPESSVEEDKLREEVQLTFKKALTAREQAVFDYFVEHKSQTIFAKDLAKLLDLPRDYVYKYIKNLRNKINEEAIYNSENGGFILKV